MLIHISCQVADFVATARLLVGPPPARFVHDKLDDVSAEEGSRACINVELTELGGKVQWFVNGKPIIPDSKRQTVASGLTRTLVILDCKRVEDEVSPAALLFANFKALI